MTIVQNLTSRVEIAEKAVGSYQSCESASVENDEVIRKRLGQLHTTVDLLKGERDTLQIKSSNLEKELKHVLGENDFMAKKLANQAELLQAQSSRHESSSGEAAAMRSSIKALESKLNELRNDKAGLTSSLDAACARIDELESMNLPRTSDDVENLRSALESARASEQATAVQCSHLEGQISELAMRLKKSKEEVQLLQLELSNVNMTSDQMRSSITDLQNIRLERDELLIEVEKSAQQVAELTEALIEADSLNSPVNSCESDSVDALKQELVDVLQNLDEMTEKAAETGLQYDTLRAEFEIIGAKVSELENCIDHKNR
jgi:chromosome segregation ATPase